MLGALLYVTTTVRCVCLMVLVFLSLYERAFAASPPHAVPVNILEHSSCISLIPAYVVYTVRLLEHPCTRVVAGEVILAALLCGSLVACLLPLTRYT